MKKEEYIKKSMLKYRISDVVEMIAEELKVDSIEAMNMFYNSEVFEKLTDFETGLYSESSAYVFDLYRDELNFGKMVQLEI